MRASIVKKKRGPGLLVDPKKKERSPIRLSEKVGHIGREEKPNRRGPTTHIEDIVREEGDIGSQGRAIVDRRGERTSFLH